MLKPLLTDDMLENHPLNVQVELLKAERKALIRLSTIKSEPFGFARAASIVAQFASEQSQIIFSSKDEDD